MHEAVGALNRSLFLFLTNDLSGKDEPPEQSTDPVCLDLFVVCKVVSFSMNNIWLTVNGITDNKEHENIKHQNMSNFSMIIFRGRHEELIVLCVKINKNACVIIKTRSLMGQICKCCWSRY